MGGVAQIVTNVGEDLALRGVNARAEGPGMGCARPTQRPSGTMTGSVREIVQRSVKALKQDGHLQASQRWGHDR